MGSLARRLQRRDDGGSPHKALWTAHDRTGPPRSLAPRDRALETSGISQLFALGVDREGVIPLWFGEGDLPTPDFICATASQSLKAGNTFYSHKRGIPALREAIVAYMNGLFGAALDVERITVTSSGMNGIMLALQTIAGAGDSVVVVSPVWPNIMSGVRIMGAALKTVSLHSREDGFHLDMDALMAACGERTRAVFVNSPSNPTGWVMGREDQRALPPGPRSGLSAPLGPAPGPPRLPRGRVLRLLRGGGARRQPRHRQANPRGGFGRPGPRLRLRPGRRGASTPLFRRRDGAPLRRARSPRAAVPVERFPCDSCISPLTTWHWYRGPRRPISLSSSGRVGTDVWNGRSGAMASYVLSTAFSDQVFLTYAQAYLQASREHAGQVAGKIAARVASARRERALRQALSLLNERSLRDIGLA